MNLEEQREEYLNQRSLAITELRDEYTDIIKDGIWQHIADSHRDRFIRDIITKGEASPLGLRVAIGCRILQYESLLNRYRDKFNLIQHTQHSSFEVPTFHLDDNCLRDYSKVDYNIVLISELIALHPELGQSKSSPNMLTLMKNDKVDGDRPSIIILDDIKEKQ